MSMLQPNLAALAVAAPWTDKKGRLHPLRATVFTLLWLPMLWLAARTLIWGLGTRPVTVALHSTGYWTIWILLISLMVTPAKALAGLPNIAVVRRMIGVAALAYVLAHLVLYCMDQNWRLLAIVTEIAVRFYLTIGFVALVGLCVLGATSTDDAIRRLGKRWKSIHRIVYAAATLGVVHYYLQSKADVSQAVIASGIFAWLMLWRRLPTGPDRQFAPLLGLAVTATALTIAFEYLWYRLGTRIDPMRVLRAEVDLAYGLHPAGLVLVWGLAVAALTELRRISLGAFGQTLGFSVLLFASGAFLDDAARFVFGLGVDDAPTHPGLPINLIAASVLGLLGLARYRLRDTPQRHVIDALWLAACFYPLSLLQGDNDPRLAVPLAALVLGGGLVTARAVWPVSRGAAIMLAPLIGWIAFESAETYLM